MRKRVVGAQADARSAVEDGDLRFVLSLRAVGEGHISSMTFRSGTIASNGSVAVDATARRVADEVIAGLMAAHA